MPKSYPFKRDNPTGAVNEQGSPTAIDLAWLAGHFDGDGWIGMVRQRRSNSTHLRYTASAVVSTTSDRIRDRVMDCLDMIGCSYNVIEFPPQLSSHGSQHRRKWNITVRSNIAADKFLTAIRPYLVEKQKQADIVLEYIEWRTAQPKQTGGAKANQPQIVGMKEYAESVMERLRADRNRDDPSTTTRLAPALAG